MPAATDPSRPGSWVTRRFWAASGLAFLLFAVYGSLVPFRLRELAPADAFRTFGAVIGQPPLRLSKTDLVANVLLFVPIGFCLTGALRLDRLRWWTGPVAALGALGISVPWSVFVEFLQVFTTDRMPSVGDIAAQTVGCLAGVVAWEAFGTPLSSWLRSALAAQTRLERVERVLALYASAWLVVNLAPFDITLDVGTLVGKLRGGGIQLVPMPVTWPRQPWPALAWDVATTVLSAAPLGVLAVIGWTAHGTRRAWTRALRLAVAAILLVEFTQVFIASHAADVNDLLFGSLGAALGVWWASRWSGRPLAERQSVSIGASWALAAVAAWGLVLAAYHWMPFDFRLDGAMVRARLASMSLVPFASYRGGNDLGALSQVLVKASLAIPLGVLCGIASASLRVRCPVLAAFLWLALAAAWFTLVEAGQLLLPSRLADPTDVLVQVVGVSIGLVLAAWVRSGR